MNSHPAPPKLEGRLLLADPSLRNENFHKSVILLADHSPEEGAFGLILNHPSGQTVGDLLSDTEFSALSNVQVHIGGPVSRGQLIFSAFWNRDSKLGSAVRISAEEAIAYLGQPGTIVRAFAGYSGWTKNQLEDEVEQQAWTVIEPDSNILTSDHEPALWKILMRGLSPYHRILADAPDEILAN